MRIVPRNLQPSLKRVYADFTIDEINGVFYYHDGTGIKACKYVGIIDPHVGGVYHPLGDESSWFFADRDGVCMASTLGLLEKKKTDLGFKGECEWRRALQPRDIVHYQFPYMNRPLRVIVCHTRAFGIEGLLHLKLAKGGVSVGYVDRESANITRLETPERCSEFADLSFCLRSSSMWTEFSYKQVADIDEAFRVLLWSAADGAYFTHKWNSDNAWRDYDLIYDISVWGAGGTKEMIITRNGLVTATAKWDAEAQCHRFHSYTAEYPLNRSHYTSTFIETRGERQRDYTPIRDCQITATVCVFRRYIVAFGELYAQRSLEYNLFEE